MTESWRNILVDSIGLQVNAYTWYRFGLIQPFLIPGRIRVLNIGTARGFETIRLLRRGSYQPSAEGEQHVLDGGEHGGCVSA